MTKKRDYNSRRCSSAYSTRENEAIMRAHRRYEADVRRELQMESQIIDVVDPDMCISTRLDRTRILREDTDA